jgi:hypothetical protein
MNSVKHFMQSLKFSDDGIKAGATNILDSVRRLQFIQHTLFETAHSINSSKVRKRLGGVGNSQSISLQYLMTEKEEVSEMLSLKNPETMVSDKK